jgi:hypothetical protein
VRSRWVRLEANAGSEIDGLIPIRLDEADVPFEYGHLHAADLTDWDGVSEHLELSSVILAVDRLLRRGAQGVDGGAKAFPTLVSHTTLSLSLELGGDLGSTDPRDLMYIDGQVREAGRKAVPALLAALDFPDAPRRGHAAYLLGLTGDPDVVSALVPLLSDRAKVGIVNWLPSVRIAAARALKKIGTPEALQALANAFE